MGSGHSFHDALERKSPTNISLNQSYQVNLKSTYVSLTKHISQTDQILTNDIVCSLELLVCELELISNSVTARKEEETNQ